MATISKTIIGTDTSGYDLCKGFALFPKLGTIRAGLQVGNKEKTLIDVCVNLGIVKIWVDVGASLFCGICGPAYATRFFCEGTATDTAVDLTVTDDRVAAGILWGFSVTFGFYYKVEHWRIRKPHWVTDKEGDKDWTLDIMGLVVSLLMEFIGKDNKKKPGGSEGGSSQGSSQTGIQKVEDQSNASISGVGAMYGIFDMCENTYNQTYTLAQDLLDKRAGIMRCEPTLTVPIDIVTLWKPMKTFMEMLEKVGGWFQTGPTVGISIPVTVEPVKVTTGGLTYDTASYTNSKLHVTRSGSGSVGGINTLGVNLKHEPGFDIRIGWFISVGLFKLVDWSKEISFPILNMLGVEIKLGTYYNDLQSNVGATTVAGLDERIPLDQQRPIEVVFDVEPVSVV